MKRLMPSFGRKLSLLALVLTGHTWTCPAQSSQIEALKEFQSRVQNYIEIHEKAKASVGPAPEATADVAVIVAHQQKVAQAIRALRPKTDRGNTFSPTVRTMIANIINMLDSKAKQAILDEGNPRAEESTAIVSLAVNATYPSTAPRSTMPPSLLLALPTLPPPVEFRFVGRTLILLDREANLIVDIMTDAI